MYKVLLAEDEVLVRNYLRTLIPWETHGFVICGEATNGQAAVELIRDMKPDIVITDIHMPGMDGIALSKHIEANEPDIKLIVLSSYDTFSYVRETMKSGAIDYLLKHALEKDALLEVLGKARKEIEKVSRDNENRERVQRNWQTVARNYVKELVLGMEDRIEIIEDYFRHSTEVRIDHLMVVTMQVGNFPMITANYSEIERNQYVRSIHDLCRQSLGDARNGIVAHIEQGKFAFLLFFPNQRGESGMLQRASVDTKRIEQALYTYLNVQVAYGMSAVGHRLSQVHAMYRHAGEQLEYNLLQQYSGVRTAGAKAEGVDILTLTIEQEKELLAAVDYADHPKVRAILADIFESLRKPSVNSYSIQAVVSELIQIANKVWSKSGVQGDVDEEERASALPRERLREKVHLNDIEAWVQSRYTRLLDKLAQRKLAGVNPYVKQAMKFVRERYRDHLSLELAAEAAGISAPYLGKLLKEEVGVSFPEFVNRHRVEMSKQRIESGRKIKEVFEDVGFSSYNYYFKVFKDVEGMTPQTYLKSIRNHRGPKAKPNSGHG